MSEILVALVRIIASAACDATTTDNIIAAAAIVARLQIEKPTRPMSR
jgi:hypothetical protein